MTTSKELDDELKKEFDEVYGETPIEDTEFYQELVKKDKEE